jgi:hypothetical protein
VRRPPPIRHLQASAVTDRLFSTDSEIVLSMASPYSSVSTASACRFLPLSSPHLVRNLRCHWVPFSLCMRTTLYANHSRLQKPCCSIL